jgi:hypothetical protein
MSAAIWSTIATLLLGATGWLIASFVGRPVIQFRELRGEVIRVSVLYANVEAAAKQDVHGYRSHVELDDFAVDRLREAQTTFRDLAAKMRAFALNETVAIFIVKRWPGYDPMEASTALMGMSNNLATYGAGRAAASKRLQEVLRFRTE